MFGYFLSKQRLDISQKNDLWMKLRLFYVSPSYLQLYQFLSERLNGCSADIFKQVASVAKRLPVYEVT